MHEPVPARPTRDIQLDVMRGFSFLAVAGFHANALVGGWIGVQVFFVLSGYWITKSWLQLSERRRTRTFFYHRAVRLLPALVAFLALWFLLSTLVPGFDHVWSSATSSMLSDAALLLVPLVGITNWWLIEEHPFPLSLGHLWSLAVEWQFYIVAPLLLLLIARTFTHKGAKKLRYVGITAVIAASVATACANAVLAFTSSSSSSSTAYYSTIGRLSPLLAGVAVALLREQRRTTTHDKTRMMNLARHATLPCIAVLAAMCIAMYRYLASVGVGLMIVTACSAILLWHWTELRVSDTDAPATSTSMWKRSVAWCGKRSYAAYLWNLPVVYLSAGVFAVVLDAPSMNDVVFGDSSPAFLAFFYLLTLLVSLGLAAASWTLVESPALRRMSSRANR